MLEKDLKLCEDSIMGFGLTRPPHKEPEVEQKIKIEEPELKRFKKDDVQRAKTRQGNLERDDKLAREEENLAREKDNVAREKDNLAREKDKLAREKDKLARDIAPAREKKPPHAIATGIKPAREDKVIQNIAAGTTPVRAATASQAFTTAYTQSAHHERNLGIITKSESSMADSKPGSQELCAGKQPEGFKMTKELKQLALTTWKELLVKTKDYTPFKVRTIKDL